MTAEMGKPLAEALAEVDKCAWNCEIVAELAPGWLADHEVASAASTSWLSYEPIGVVFAVMPWNYPFWQVLRFACAALAAGNAAILKHSPNVTGCALAIERLFLEAGAPAGLFRTAGDRRRGDPRCRAWPDRRPAHRRGDPDRQRAGWSRGGFGRRCRLAEEERARAGRLRPVRGARRRRPRRLPPTPR